MTTRYNKKLALLAMALLAIVALAAPSAAWEYGGTNSTAKSTAALADMAFTANTPAGVVLARTAYYKPAIDVGAGTIVDMVPIPKGAMILDIHVNIAQQATNATLDFGARAANGTGDDVDRFFDGATTAAAQFITKASTGTTAVANPTYWDTIFGDDSMLTMKVVTGTYAANTATTVTVFYKMADAIKDEEAAFDE